MALLRPVSRCGGGIASVGTWLPIANLPLSSHYEKPLFPLHVGDVRTQAAAPDSSSFWISSVGRQRRPVMSLKAGCSVSREHVWIGVSAWPRQRTGSLSAFAISHQMPCNSLHILVCFHSGMKLLPSLSTFVGGFLGRQVFFPNACVPLPLHLCVSVPTFRPTNSSFHLCI